MIEKEKFYESHIWKSLLHVNNGLPAIKEKNFLLSYDDFSLKNELILNIKQIELDNNYRCKFPARYEWIRKQFPTLNNENSKCNDFDEYLEKTNANSLDLIFVSENIKNPSSMMGHVFFNINGIYEEKNRMNAVSFYTMINHFNIPLLAYESMIKGMPGYFVLSPYQKQISNYVNKEERNVWKYKLNITKEQLTLIYYHFWELKDINITYYFTGFNCATIVNDILSITSESYYNEKTNLWSTPKNVINKANRFNIITTNDMTPSLEWNLYMLNENIDGKEINKLKELIDSENLLVLKKLVETNKISELEIEFIENYVKYLYMKENLISYDKYKKILLLIKQEKKSSVDFSDYKNPINSQDNKQMSIGIITREKDNYLELNLLLAGNTINDDNRNYFAENSLKIGNINLLINKSKSFINRLDLYEMKSYLPINNIMTPLSSEIGISYSSHFNNLYLKDSVILKGGFGLTNKITQDMFLYYLINLEMYVEKDYVYPIIKPKFGLNIYEVLNMKAVFEYEYEYNLIKDENSFHKIKLDQSLTINNNSRIDLNYTLMKGKDKDTDIVGLRYNYFF